jgi:hypothetical protein
MNNKFTRLTLEQDDLKLSWEVPYKDVIATEMVEAFHTLMIGMTFTEQTFFDTLAKYLSENSNYKVTK